MKYYPAFLNLKGRLVLVVGGGEIALQKLFPLLECQAKIHVVSPEAQSKIRQLARDGKIILSERVYEPADTKDTSLVIAATSDPKVQKRVARDARAAKIWVNVVDVPHLCDFIAPAVVSRGELQIAVSTGGAAPALAKHLREKLEVLLGLGYADFVKMAKKLRPDILKLPKRKRLSVWKALIHGRS